MKKDDIKKGLKNFTYVCLFDENIFNSEKNEIVDVIKFYGKKAKDLKEFCLLVLKDKKLQKSKYNQGYWELAREYCLKYDDLRYSELVKEYLEEIADNHLTTISDIGSILLGNENFKIAINNGYGDSENDVYIINKNVDINCLHFNTSFEGKDINIYSYDCARSEDESLIKLSGRYAIYSFIRKDNNTFGDRIFAIIKWE